MIWVHNGVVRDENGISDEYKIFATIMRNVVNIDRKFDSLSKLEVLSEIHRLVIAPMNVIAAQYAKAKKAPPPYYKQEMWPLIGDMLHKWNGKLI